jgi:ferredoxin--NADP+ reductase
MATLFRERVLSVNHWTERQFSFTTTRDPSFRFLNGQFTMIGMEVDGRRGLPAVLALKPITLKDAEPRPLPYRLPSICHS